MKKDTSSNSQDAGHTEGQGRNIPATGKKDKINNSQTMDDMRDRSDGQEGDVKKQGKGRSNTGTGNTGKS